MEGIIITIMTGMMGGGVEVEVEGGIIIMNIGMGGRPGEIDN